MGESNPVDLECHVADDFGLDQHIVVELDDVDIASAAAQQVLGVSASQPSLNITEYQEGPLPD